MVRVLRRLSGQADVRHFDAIRKGLKRIPSVLCFGPQRTTGVEVERGADQDLRRAKRAKQEETSGQLL